MVKKPQTKKISKTHTHTHTHKKKKKKLCSQYDDHNNIHVEIIRQ